MDSVCRIVMYIGPQVSELHFFLTMLGVEHCVVNNKVFFLFQMTMIGHGAYTQIEQWADSHAGSYESFFEVGDTFSSALSQIRHRINC